LRLLFRQDRLFGYAGTGKTTLAKKIAEDADGGVAFAAFTGKAALVMWSKGCEDARTIHSLIYRARETDTEGPSFVLNEDSTITKSSLVIVDECSMVDADLGRHDDVFPQLGDKLVCVRNDKKKGLVNGGIWLVKTTARTRKKKLALNVVPDPAQAAAHRRSAGVLSRTRGKSKPKSPQGVG
jgi:ATP-dependent exoDNAse (exonuclease V) alpha subunit